MKTQIKTHIKAFCCGDWVKRSVRKPLAVYSTIFVYGLSFLGWLFQHDLPPNISAILTTVLSATIVSYFVGSAYEAGKKPLEIEGNKKDG